jgi:hypothetical protein
MADVRVDCRVGANASYRTHHTLEYFTDLARSKVAEAAKGEIAVALAVGAVEEDDVQMRVELDRSRCAARP